MSLEVQYKKLKNLNILQSLGIFKYQNLNKFNNKENLVHILDVLPYISR